MYGCICNWPLLDDLHSISCGVEAKTYIWLTKKVLLKNAEDWSSGVHKVFTKHMGTVYMYIKDTFETRVNCLLQSKIAIHLITHRKHTCVCWRSKQLANSMSTNQVDSKIFTSILVTCLKRNFKII